MNVLIKNEKVTLLIDDEGISYGGYQIPWSDISQVYARGGVLLNFKRGYQVGYLSKGAIQAFKELTIDGHFQKNEINGLFRSLDMELGSRGHDVVFNYLD
jgi:hypothetical protein